MRSAWKCAPCCLLLVLFGLAFDADRGLCGLRQIFVVAKGQGVEAMQSLMLANVPCRVIFPFVARR